MNNLKSFLKPDGTSWALIGLVILLVLGFSSAMGEKFFSDTTFTSIAFQLPELGLLTLAMFIPMLNGGFNLAIIATANITSLFMAWLLIHHLPADAGLSAQILWLLLAIGGAVLIAILTGSIIGALIARVGAHPILVTLAIMTTINGIGIYLSHGAALSGMPRLVRHLGSDTLLGIPIPLIIFLCCAFGLAVLLGKTKLGKYIYMSGSNINATYFSGIRTHWVLIKIYVLSSILCAVAGLVMMSRFNSARMGYGDSYLLLTVLAIILGGANPFGGFGKVCNIVLALVVLQTISTGLNLLEVSPHFSLAMWGLVLIVVLAFRFFANRYAKQRAMRKLNVE